MNDRSTMKAADFKKLDVYEVITENLTLADRKNPDGSLVTVKVYRHKKSEAAFQVDFKNGVYREAKHVLMQYGDWKKLD